VIKRPGLEGVAPIHPKMVYSLISLLKKQKVVTMDDLLKLACNPYFLANNTREVIEKLSDDDIVK